MQQNGDVRGDGATDNQVTDVMLTMCERHVKGQTRSTFHDVISP